MDDRTKGVNDADKMVGRAAEDVLGYSDSPRVVRPVEDEYVAGPVAREGNDESPAKRTREIRQEIEQTRDEMSETIDAIQEKLRPRNIVAQATSSVKSAATERVRDMREIATTAGGAAGDTARQNPVPLALMGIGAAWLLMNRSSGSSSGRSMNQRYVTVDGDVTGGNEGWTDRIKNSTEGLTDRIRNSSEGLTDRIKYSSGGWTDRIKNNPVPAAMAGLGLAWLAFGDSGERSTSSSDYSRYRSAGDYDSSRLAGGHTVGGYGAASYEGEPYGAGSYVGEYSGSETGSTTGSSVSGMAGDVASRAQDIAGGVASRAQDVAQGATRTARQTTRRAQNQLQRMLQNNPLMVGAAAAAIGAAVGAALPETERENEWMGEARDTMVTKAQDMARDAAGKVQDAAGGLAETAGLVTGDKTQGQ